MCQLEFCVTCGIAGIEERAGTLVWFTSELVVSHSSHIDEGFLFYGEHLEVSGYHDALRLTLLLATPDDFAVIDAHSHLCFLLHNGRRKGL